MHGSSCRASCGLLHVCVFAVAALVLAMTACASVDTPNGFTLVGDQLDSRGGDLSKHCRVSHYFCANKCRNNTACVAFTWVESGRTGAECCYTKSRLADPLTSFRAGDAGYTFARDVAPPAPPPERTVFVFGDSLSDTGGAYGIWQKQASQGVPEAQRVPLATLGYFEHKFSNGNTWPLRVKEALPEALRDVEVTSFAVGGSSALPLYLLDEVISFSYPHVATQFGTAAEALAAGNVVRGKTSVCILWAGSNDLQELSDPIVIFNRNISQSAPLISPGVAPTPEQLADAQSQYIGAIVATLANNYDSLSSSEHCDKVMVVSIPPLHRLPNFNTAVTFAVKAAVAASFEVCPPWPTPCPGYDDLIEQGSVNGIADAINGMKAAVDGINAAIVQDVAFKGVQSGGPIAFIDVDTFINSLFDDPAMYGFTDATSRCMTSSDPLTASDPSATLVSTCNDPNTFTSWDGLHPTAAVHALLGAVIAAALEGSL